MPPADASMLWLPGLILNPAVGGMNKKLLLTTEFTEKSF